MAILPYKSVVTVPAASKDMTVLATVKTELKISGTTEDAYLATLIQQASSKAVELCNREFAKETLVDFFRINHQKGPGAYSDWPDTMLKLTRRPIVSVASVVEDGVTLAVSDYEIIADQRLLQRIDADGNPILWSWTDKIVVTYDAGWVLLTNLPHALERIVINEIKRHWFARVRDPLLRSQDIPDVARLDYWIERESSGSGGSKDPMLSDLEAAGFVEAMNA